MRFTPTKNTFILEGKIRLIYPFKNHVNTKLKYTTFCVKQQANTTTVTIKLRATPPTYTILSNSKLLSCHHHLICLFTVLIYKIGRYNLIPHSATNTLLITGEIHTQMWLVKHIPWIKLCFFHHFFEIFLGLHYFVFLFPAFFLCSGLDILIKHLSQKNKTKQFYNAV